MILGLTLGIFPALICLSGSLIVFAPELDRLLNPGLLITQHVEGQNKQMAGLDSVLDTALESYPADKPLEFSILHLPRFEHGVHQILMKEGFETGDGPWLEAIVDPVSGVLLGTRQPEDSIVGKLIAFHIHLLIGEGSWGESAVGILGGILFIIFALSGLGIWWPGLKRFARVFRLRRHKGSELLARDIHRSFGGLTSPLVLISVFSGILLVFPDQFMPAIKLLIPDSVPTETTSYIDRAGLASELSILRQQEALSIDTVVRASNKILAPYEVTSVHPRNGAEVYELRIRRPEDPKQYYTDGSLKIGVNIITGELVSVEDSLTYSLQRKFAEVWLFPLHTGELFGLTGRLIVFSAGLVPPLLWITGIYAWWLKSRRASAFLN